jgi:hypothetical protein
MSRPMNDMLVLLYLGMSSIGKAQRGRSRHQSFSKGWGWTKDRSTGVFIGGDVSSNLNCSFEFLIFYFFFIGFQNI